MAEQSAAVWHLIPVDNYIGDRLVRWGWGASFGRSAPMPGCYRNGAKHWGDQRVHPAVNLTGPQGPTLTARLVHHVDRNISDMLARLDRYTTARAQDLRESGDIGTYRRNLRRIVSRFWKCYVAPARLSRRSVRVSDRALRGALPDPLLPEGAAREGVMASVVMADDGIAFDGATAEAGPLGGAETAFVALAEALARARPPGRGAQPLRRAAAASGR